MKIKPIILLTLMLMSGICAFCQTPPKEFFEGMDSLYTNPVLAKKDLQIAAAKMPQFHGTYHFLGVISLNEKKPDSAIVYFIKSIALNEGNINHTKEFTYVRLINTYAQQQDFANAFKTAWDAANLYPDSKVILATLHDLCLWSYYIKHNELDPGYLSPDIKPEYVVNNIDEEYLITRNLRVNDHPLATTEQKLVNKNTASYDVLKCVVTQTKQEVEVSFKINWDMGKYFGGKPGPAQEVISDTKNPVYERVGAMLVLDSKTDIKSSIEKMTH
jgi:tetratricopeptide (TPR) repeat protein